MGFKITLKPGSGYSGRGLLRWHSEQRPGIILKVSDEVPTTARHLHQIMGSTA